MVHCKISTPHRFPLSYFSFPLMDEVQFPLLLTILLLTLVLFLAVLELVLIVLDLPVNEIFNTFSFLAFFIFSDG